MTKFGASITLMEVKVWLALQSYEHNLNGLIYMVDSTWNGQQMQSARNVLKYLVENLNSKIGNQKNGLLLVLANKQVNELKQK